MKNLWSKEDLANFNKSEVFSELEARVLENIKRADILQKKLAQSTLEQQTKSLQDLGNAASEASKSVQNLNEQISSAEDDLEDEEDMTEDVVSDLYSMARAAIANGDYKVAYQIERTIDEILEKEVSCE
jgi:anti-sigma28 factor (negative regulator of flagellin synthesis)